jgi:predicted RNA-binding protein with RPS1 domain
MFMHSTQFWLQVAEGEGEASLTMRKREREKERKRKREKQQTADTPTTITYSSIKRVDSFFLHSFIYTFES